MIEEISNLQATREKQTHALSITEAIKNLSRYEIRTPFLLSIFVFLFAMFSGPFAIIFYAVDIFKEAGVNSNQHMAAIITAVVRIGGGIVSIFLIHKLPRVKLAMAAMSLMSISILALGTVIYFKDQYEDNIVLCLPSSANCSCHTLHVFFWSRYRRFMTKILTYKIYL